MFELFIGHNQLYESLEITCFAYAYNHCFWKKTLKFHSHVKMDIMKLVHFATFRSPLKYISLYEMAWKLAFMVHQHVIEFWEKFKCCSLRIFLFNESICMILKDNFTSNFIGKKFPQRLYLFIYLFIPLITIVIQCIEIEPFFNICVHKCVT